MIKYLFDTSVIVAALFSGHKHFSRSLAWIQAVQNKKIKAYISGHCLAELYSNLSAYYQDPLLPTETCRTIIRKAILEHFSTIELTRQDYLEVIDRLAQKDLRNGAIYDGLHVQTARKKRLDGIVTLNVKDFHKLIDPDEMILVNPLESHP